MSSIFLGCVRADSCMRLRNHPRSFLNGQSQTKYPPRNAACTVPRGQHLAWLLPRLRFSTSPLFIRFPPIHRLPVLTAVVSGVSHLCRRPPLATRLLGILHSSARAHLWAPATSLFVHRSKFIWENVANDVGVVFRSCVRLFWEGGLLRLCSIYDKKCCWSWLGLGDEGASTMVDRSPSRECRWLSLGLGSGR